MKADDVAGAPTADPAGPGTEAPAVDALKDMTRARSPPDEEGVRAISAHEEGTELDAGPQEASTFVWERK